MGYPGSNKGTFVVTSNSVAATPPSEGSFSKISVTTAGSIVVKGNNLYTFVSTAYVKKDPSEEFTISMVANQTIEGEFTSVRLAASSAAGGVVAYI